MTGLVGSLLLTASVAAAGAWYGLSLAARRINIQRQCQHLHARMLHGEEIAAAGWRRGDCGDCGLTLDDRPYTTATGAQDRRLALPVPPRPR